MTAQAGSSGVGHAFSADIADARRGYFRVQADKTESFRGATSEVVRVGR
ncbi:hypothetical protein [Streptomyces collinus]